MLMPTRTKYRKQQKGRLRCTREAGSNIDFGKFGLKAQDRGWLTARQIEAGRIAISRHVKRSGKIWIRIFPDKPLTKKPLETRMGKGKGPPEVWVAAIRPGRILYEIDGVSDDVAKEALRLAARKLAIKTKIVSREQFYESK